MKSTLLQLASGHWRWTFAHWSQLRHWTAFRPRPWWGQRARRWASRRRFQTVCAEILRLCNPMVSSAFRVTCLRQSHRWRSRMWRSWCGYTWSAVVRPVGRTAKFSKTTLEAAYCREINIKFSGNSSGRHSYSEHANCTLPQFETSVALCCVKTLHILEWPFIVLSRRCTCVMIMLFN